MLYNMTMKALRLLIVPALALAVAASTLASEWMTDYNKALALSKKTGKPILADFTGSDWCGWCIRLKGEVFSKPEFAAWAKKNVILLELDYPRRKALPAGIVKQNEILAAKYKIEGYPTILFLGSKGQVLGQYGYDQGGPKTWTANADKMLKGKKV
jgi:thiol-disulfide isomerase/thioredoxin